MILKRLAAVALSIGLIAAAFGIRRGLIESPDDASTRPAVTEASTLICPTELATVCRSIVLPDDLDLVVDDVGSTVDRLADGDTGDAVLWLTYEPFPAVVDQIRGATGRPTLGLTTEGVASSPLALVVPTGSDTGCGPTIDWRCLGDGERSVGFAAGPGSGLGLLGVVAAASGYAGGAGVPFGDAVFEVWLRDVISSVRTSQLSAGTAVATILVRPSAMDVAVGAAAELPEDRRDAFDVLYAGEMGSVRVVLATSSGVDLPDGLADDVAAALATAGWDPADAALPGTADAGVVIATRDFWSDL